MKFQHLAFPDAASVLTDADVAIIPLGASLKSHGAHLPLNTDRLLAEALTERIRIDNVVVTPTVDLSYYPAFASYPGSVSIDVQTSTALIVDLCRGLSRHGMRRFYVLNTGLSTRHPLLAAQKILARDGCRMAFTDIETVGEPAESALAQQAAGSHADELETSMMLFLHPKVVDMSKAVADTRADIGFGARVRPSGVFGDPTLASRKKGERIVEQWIENIRLGIEDLKAAG